MGNKQPRKLKEIWICFLGGNDASVVRRKSFDVWISILAPEAQQIIAGDERFLRIPGLCDIGMSPEGAGEY